MAKLFRENNIEYKSVNFLKEPLDEKKLRELLTKAQLSPFDAVRKNDSSYKELKISKITSESELIKIIIENPTILQRPIVEIGGTAVLVRPIGKAVKLIKSGEINL